MDNDPPIIYQNPMNTPINMKQIKINPINFFTIKSFLNVLFLKFLKKLFVLIYLLNFFFFKKHVSKII